MPAQHNLNVPPYHDDWDPKNNFNRVMFRPGFPIQARELNQAQGILQDQIEQIASSLMKDGDVITPGEFFMTNPAPYIRVSSITNGSRPEEYIGYNFVGVQSGVKARVVHAEEATETDDVTFYVIYESQGSNSEQETFLEQETLESDTPQNYTAKVGVTSISKPVSTAAVGNGTLFTVTEGAYYVNGFVVRNEEQIITLDKYGTGPNFQVGFIITEEFVTSAEDSSLLDNAQGYSNFAAPGADRLKVTLNLGKLLLGSKVPDFIMLARVENGSIIGKTDKSIKWDWLYDILAKRTFDESGNYIVSDFAIKPQEYWNSIEVDGVWDPDTETGEYPPIPKSGSDIPLDFDAADALYAIRVDPGLAYVQGYEVGFASPFYVYGNKPRQLQFQSDNYKQITQGHKVAVTNCYGAPSLTNIQEGATINAFDTLTLYRNFADGYVGESKTITPNGEITPRPSNWGNVPNTTVHIIADRPIGDLSDIGYGYEQSEIVYNPPFSNSCVISPSTPRDFKRGSSIGDAEVLVANVITPRPSGVMKPRSFTPQRLTADELSYNNFNSTFDLGFLTSTYFTELAVVFDVNSVGEDLEWKIGEEVAGRASQAVGVVEQGSTNELLILSNIIGEFINGEYIEQQQGVDSKKIFRILKPGEVVAFQFPTDGQETIDKSATITVQSLGLETTLYQGPKEGIEGSLCDDTSPCPDGFDCINGQCTSGDCDDINLCTDGFECIDGKCVSIPGDYYYDDDKATLVITNRGRDKLYNFPYTGGSSLNERVNYTLTTSTGATGYAITAPAKITNTLNKTKSIYSDLSVLDNDKFSADVSFQDSIDAEVFRLANGALFAGDVGNNYIECEDFAGDASEELIANDVITLIDDLGNSVNKLVLFSTKPVGYGRDRTKCRIYFTTTLENKVSSKSVQRMRIRTYGDETQNLIYELPISTVATLQTDPKTTRIDYTFSRQFIQRVVNGATSVTISTMRDNERFVSDLSKVSVTMLRGQTNQFPDTNGRFLNVIGSSFGDDDSRQITFFFAGPVPDNVVLKITCQIKIVNTQAKRKILKNKSLEISPKIQSQPDLISTNKLPSNRVLSLETADVLRVNSITQGQPAGMEGAIDVSDNYLFDNGQRDNYYDISRLILMPGRPASLDNVFVNFDYFEHDDQGDFFSVDSYTHDQGVRYGEIPTYTQGSTGLQIINKGRVVQLRDCIDFRPIVNTIDSVIASITPQVTAGFATNFKDTNSGGNAFAPNIPVANTDFKCDISYYLPRYDSLFLDKSGSLVLLEGNPSVNPTPPADLSTAIRLYDLYMPAYTFSMKDVEVKKFNYRRYTMSDIASIDRKLDNIQEVVSLTLLELSAINTSVRDAVTGLDRFKNGVVVDPFKDHSKGDVDSIDYKCSIDPVRTHLRPGVFADQIELEEKNQTNNQRLADKYDQNDNIVTVPFDSVDFLANPYATRSISLHPFSSFSYHGSLKLYPEVDTFRDLTKKPDMIVENNPLYDAMLAMPDSRVRSGFNSVYGDWETNATAQTSKTNVVLDKQDKSLLKVTDINQSSIKLKDQPNSKYNTETSSVKHTSYGDRIIDIQLGETMRSRPVYFHAGRLKPNSRYYAFFDDVNVSDWVVTNAISSDYPDKVTRYIDDPTNRGTFGDAILSDSEGVISGVFIVPNGRRPLQDSSFNGEFSNIVYDTSGTTRSFNTGQRVFKLTNNINNSLDKDTVGAYTEAVYTSGVVIEDKQETIVSTRLTDNSHRSLESDRSSRTITSTGVSDIEVSVRGPERLARTVEVSKEYVTDTTSVRETEVVREVQVLSDGTSDVEVRYDVSTEREVVTVQAPEDVKYIEVEQRPQPRMIDPIAQTFLVDSTNPEGVFVTELDIAFEKKDHDQAVMAYIVTTEGGVPTKSIVPHSKVVKNPHTTIRVKCEIPDGLPSAVLKGGFVINGRSSGASGVIRSDVTLETSTANPDKNVENHVYNLVIDNYEGEFLAGEIITSPNLIGERALAVFTIVNDEYELTRVDLFDMGEGYDETTTVRFSEPELPGGRTASAYVKVAPTTTGDDRAPGQDGQVYEVVITDPGYGYVNVPLVYIVGPGTDAQAICRTRPGRKAVSMGVATSIDGSIMTTFRFEAPVYLLGNTEYAFVVESPNTVDYKIYTSKLGETIIDENARVTKQPNLGTLFKSQNGGVWSEDQTQDVKFLMRRASFEVNTASKLVLNNKPLHSIRLENDPIETYYSETSIDSVNIIGLNSRIVKVYHHNHGLAPDDMVAIDGVRGDGNGDDLSGIPITELNTLHQVIDTDLNSFTIKVTSPAYKSAVAGGSNVFCSYNRPYEALNICTGLMTFGTSLVGVTNRATQAVGLTVVDIVDDKEVRFNEDYRYVLDQPVPVKMMDTFYYEKPMQVANLVNECHYHDSVHMQDQKSIETIIRMSTVSTRVSPVIDIQRTNYTAIRNLVNKPRDRANILGAAGHIFTFAGTVPLQGGDSIQVNGNEYKVSGVDRLKRNVLVQTSPHTSFSTHSVIDGEGLTDAELTTVTQRLSEEFVPETRALGSADSKWISKLFVFENPCDGLTVKLTSIFYEADSIRAYFRPRTVGFDSDLTSDPWIPFNPQQSLPGEMRKVGPDNLILYPGDPGYRSDYPLLKTPGLADNVLEITPRSIDSINPDLIRSDEWQSITWSAQDLAKFDAVAIKIVMTCDNPAHAPLIDDFGLIVTE